MKTTLQVACKPTPGLDSLVCGTAKPEEACDLSECKLKLTQDMWG